LSLTLQQFLELPDPSKYADYYTIITEPRSINGVQEKLQKNRYRNILDVLNDLYLVFANALHYNEASSQIAKDAAVLKVCLLLLPAYSNQCDIGAI
jgi:chromatin structure-remodeling complex subunit RSC1/2